jgi:hypothetical protein
VPRDRTVLESTEPPNVAITAEAAVDPRSLAPWIITGQSGAVDEDSSSLPKFRPEDLSEKWTVVLGALEGERLRDELVRELPVGHTLHGAPILAVAVRKGLKETVWWLPDDGAWAVVHLTGRVETDPRWPTAVRLATWTEVIAELVDSGRS